VDQLEALRERLAVDRPDDARLAAIGQLAEVLHFRNEMHRELT
jgi:hypothetical protein